MASRKLKTRINDCKIVFIQFEESYRFLIATSYFAHLDSLNAENMISLLVRSEISI